MPRIRNTLANPNGTYVSQTAQGTTVGTSTATGSTVTVNFTGSPWWMRTDGSFYHSTTRQDPSDVQAIMGIDETGTPYVVVPGSGTQSTLALINAVKAAVLQHVATAVTSAGALVVNKHNPVDASTGALTQTLPTGAAEGTLLAVEKVDSSVNAVNVTGSVRGVGSSTISLALAHETLLLVADSVGSWWPVAGHKTLASLKTALAEVTDRQKFTSSGTWTKPGTTPKMVHVRCWGAGGGGGSGARRASGTLSTGGGSGAGGAFTERWFYADDLTSTVAVTVGTGGAGGLAVTTDDTNGNAGSAGSSATFFGSSAGLYLCSAGAGSGGGAGSSAAAGTAGASSSGVFNGSAGVASSATGGAGTAGVSLGAAGPGGGSGGGIATTPANTAGGAGGGVSNGGSAATAGTAGGGTGANGGASPLTNGGTNGGGGAGGGSNIAGAAGAGGAGGFPGGGGGGGGASLNTFASGAGGTGANGLVIVETYF